jgi:hypothetical protein
MFDVKESRAYEENQALWVLDPPPTWEDGRMGLGRVRIALGILAAVTTAVAVGEAVRSSGGAAAPNQVTPPALPSTSSASPTRRSSRTAVPRSARIDIGYLRVQWIDAESQIREAGTTGAQQAQQAVAAKDGPAIAAAIDQEVAAVSAQDQRIAALAWPASIKPHIDAFESSSAAALNQLRSAASNPFGYDASQVNAAIAAFNAAANVVCHDLGLPPD